jgi:type II secretory pathway component PulK
MSRTGRRGVALVVVLGLLIALGLMAAAIARAIRLETETVVSLRARTVARYAAESGVVLAEQRLTALLDSAGSPEDRARLLNERDPWLEPLREVALGDARFGVTIVDLNARIDLNQSDTASIRNLFAQFTSATRAAEIAAAIKAAPLPQLGDLADIPGVDDALALAVAPYVTVYGDGSVNVNSAPEPVLAAVPSLGAAGAKGLMERRKSGRAFRSLSELRPDRGGSAAAGVVADEPEAGGESPQPANRTLRAVMMPTRLMVISRGWRVGHPLTHEVQAVYALAGQQLKLLLWQEKDR